MTTNLIICGRKRNNNIIIVILLSLVKKCSGFLMKQFNLIKIIVISLLLSGCLNYEQITTIKTDDSGKMFIHYWMKFYSGQDSILVNQLGIFNEDSLKSQFSAPFTKIKNISVFNDYTDSTIHAQIEFEFTKFDSLNFLKPFRNNELSIKKGPENTKIFSQFIPPFATGFGFEPQNYKLKYVYYLPGDIIKHNANEKSNNKLTWEFSLEDIGTGKTITATYIPFKLKETPLIIYIIAFIVLIIVISFLFKKRVD